MEEKHFQNTSIKVFKDIVFDKIGKKDLDVYMPPESMDMPSNGFPIVYFIHGGAWHIGGKENSRDACQSMAKNGYVCVATTYSLSTLSNEHLDVILGSIVLIMLVFALTAKTSKNMLLILMIMAFLVMFFMILWTFLPREEVQHPTHILDVAEGVKWTIDNAKTYGGNAKEIYVMGHSAGGHLAALLCTNLIYLEKFNVPVENIKGCISISGVYSDRRMMQSKIGENLLTNAFGKSDNYIDAFPIYNVTPYTCPFLLLNAGTDITLKRHTLDFHFILRQNGVFVETAYFSDRSHWNITREWGTGKRNEQVMKKISAFITERQEMLLLDPRIQSDKSSDVLFDVASDVLDVESDVNESSSV